MKLLGLQTKSMLAVFCLFMLSCEKNGVFEEAKPEKTTQESLKSAEKPPFNLEVILRGEGSGYGHVKFRQDVDAAKIITLDVWVRDLEPNHEYLLQRAVDPRDGNCTSISWLTLGKGLTPQSILTDENGKATESLWRDVTAIPTGSEFDIHFRIVDAANLNVILDSDCYSYVVR
jgi:hypothetical protein